MEAPVGGIQGAGSTALYTQSAECMADEAGSTQIAKWTRGYRRSENEAGTKRYYRGAKGKERSIEHVLLGAGMSPFLEDHYSLSWYLSSSG